MEIRDIISGYLGACGFVHRDLQSFAASLCVNHLEPTIIEEVDEDGFCYALAANGLSFAMGSYDFYWPHRSRWPRTTQLIMLNEKG